MKRNQDGCFLIISQTKLFLAQFGIKVTNPACAKSLFGCSKTKMLNCNSYVNVTVTLSVRAHPFFIVQYRRNDNNRGNSKPFTIVALAEFLSVLLAADDTELPRLLVYSGWSQTDTLHDIVQFLLFNTCRLITPTAISLFD